MAGRDVKLAGAARQAWARHHERHVQRLLIGDVPLLMHAAMRTLHISVIRAEHHNRLLVDAARSQGVQDARDLFTDGGLHLVVELEMRLDPRLGQEVLPPRLRIALMTRRLRREVLITGRRLVDVRHLRRVVTQALRDRGHAKQRVVVRIQERAHR